MVVRIAVPSTTITRTAATCDLCERMSRRSFLFKRLKGVTCETEEPTGGALVVRVSSRMLSSFLRNTK